MSSKQIKRQKAKDVQMKMEWQKAFNIPDQSLHQLKDWCLEEPKRSRHSLLYWALEHKLLSMQDYLKWAKQKHHIPLLRESFFLEKEPQNLTFWLKMEKDIPWSAELMPLFQWKNHLFITCIEKPAEEWKTLFKSKGFHAQFVLSSIEGMKIWQKKLFSKASPSPTSPLTPPGPQGKEPPPTGTTKTGGPVSGESVRSEPIRSEPAAIGGSIHTTAETTTTTTATATAIDAREGFYREPDCGPAPPDVKEAITKMEESFEACMILKLDIQKEILLPWQWNMYCQQIRKEGSQEEEKIALGENSIFRVVYRSQQPYHGYIVTSPINQQFFSQWNGGNLPEHITICPILTNLKIYGEMAGMILGFNNKINPKNNQKCLFLVQKMSKELAKSFASQAGLSEK